MPSPSHRVLYNDELLRALLAALLPGGSVLSEHIDIRLRRRTVKSLACACKSFTGPALDILWQELPSLKPLRPLLVLAIADLRKFESEGGRETTSAAHQSHLRNYFRMRMRSRIVYAGEGKAESDGEARLFEVQRAA